MTERKLNLLKWINRAGAIRANMLHTLDGGNRQNIKVALQELRNTGIIYCPHQQEEGWTEFGRYFIYALTPKGKQLLHDSGIAPIDWQAKHQFWHRVMVADIVASFEAIAHKRKLTFKSRDEILQGKPFELNAGLIVHPRTGATYDRPLFPDELFAIGDYYFALEADRNTESIERADFKASSYLRKLLQYQNVFKNQAYKDWGIDKLFVLHISTSPAHTSNIIALAENPPASSPAPIGLGIKSRGNLFKGISVLAHRTKKVEPLTTLLDEPWDRAGHPPHQF